MKIVFVNRYFYPDHSATSQLLTDLAFSLADTHQVAVVTSRQRYDDPGASLAPRESVRGVNVYRARTTGFGRLNLFGRAFDYLTFYLAAGAILCRIIGPGDIVVAKTDPPLISIVAAVVCRARGAKLVNWLQDLFPEVAEALGMRWMRGPLASCLLWLRNRSLRAAFVNVVLSEQMARRLQAQGVQARSTRVIPNWADGARITPIKPESSLFRRECGLQEKFIVCYSGNMGRAHEFDTILQAAKIIQAGEAANLPDRSVRQQRTVFLFIGEGAQRQYLENIGRSFGLSELIFKPYQSRDRLTDSLGAADVHLVSLRPQLEGLIVPSKIYGVLAAGRPIVFVGAADGEVARLVERYGAGLAVEAGDGRRLAEALVTLRDDHALRLRMGAAARSVFEARFDFQINADKFKHVLMTAASAR